MKLCAVRRSLTGGLAKMPWQVVRAVRGPQLLAPFYHAVSDRPAAHLRKLFPVPSLQSFRRDLEFFARNCVPVTLDDMVDHAQGRRPLPKRALFLSFDDGLSEVAESIAPLCKRMGIPATFFLTTGFLDNKNLCFRHLAGLIVDLLGTASPAMLGQIASALKISPDASAETLRDKVLAIGWNDAQLLETVAKILELDVADYLRTRRPYLSTDDVVQLLQDGFTIGAHSVSHPRFADIPLETQVAEATQSVAGLRAQFGMQRATFAFPFVSDGVSQAFYDAMWQAGLEMVFCVGAMPQRDGRVVQRLWMERSGVGSVSQYLRTACADEAVGRLASLWSTDRSSLNESNS